ncbi:nucleotide disphospho-sugar-binding domain-containing protein [Streptomyces sp. NPDC089915]|uniref:nucleotide disphospho-sugar-binding domain-containing protein n=1 Tax=Streptomyces sp. NPDC089915 TaxID=3155186 RepID=UPI0034466B49
MRVLFTAWAWPPHYYPLVPLAWAMRNAGHEIRVAGPPALADAITHSGQPAVEVGRDADFSEMTRGTMNIDRDAPATPELWRELRKPKGERALKMFASIAETMVDGLVDFARGWQPDLVVHSPTSYAGAIAAAAVGVPNVRVLMAPDIAYRGRHAEPALLADMCARFGVTDVNPLGALTVDPCPPRIQIPSEYPRQLMRYVPYNGPAEMPHWLLEPPTRKRVCITWGTTLAAVNPNLVLAGRMLEAVAGLDAEVIVTVAPSHREFLGPVPENVRVVEGLSLHLLLPTCDLMIHQGGNGTTMTAMASGVPQLIVPQFPDQAFVAERMAAAGAADVLLPEEADAATVRARVTDLLENPRWARDADRLRAEAEALPAPTDIVPVLEELARTGRARPVEAPSA